MLLAFGMSVIGNDGEEAGRLERVLIDPGSREVTHVVIQSPRVSEDVLLPLSLVQGSDERRLLLHILAGDLEHLPRYYEGRADEPAPSRVDTSVVREPAERRQQLEEALNVPPDTLELSRDTRVTTPEGQCGELLGISTEQYANHLSALLVSGLRPRELLIPARWIGELGSGGIPITAAGDQSDRLAGAPAAPMLARESGPPRQVIERSET